MKLIKILEDRLLDNPTKTPDQIAQDQNVDVAQVLRALRKGITVEQEHTSDIRVAREIALDHLSERWDYYDVLAKAERASVAEAEVPGTQMVTLDARQLQEALTFLQELAENINDESMNYEDRPDLFKKLERDHRAITAVETVMRNNLRALKKPELLQTNIFLYDVDDSDLSYMDFVGAIHVQLHDSVAEVKWIGSYDASGRQLMQAAMKIAKQCGATSMKLDAKWESEGFYHKMGFKQSGPTVDQPLSGSQLTPFHRELDESARLLELFDPNKLPANIRIKHTDVGERYNTWKVSIDDQQYSVDVDYFDTVDEKFADDRLGIYYVYFGLETGGGVHFGITKTGKSFEIFAAVAAILYRFQKSKPSVSGFYFSAEEPSRQKLYSALSNKMAQSLGWRNDRDLVAKYFGKNSSRSMFLITTPKLSAYMHSRLDQTTPTQELDEVVMSPNALKTWVRQNANILAGVKIGFEAEMCVTGLAGSSDDDDDDQEPDYSDDEQISDYNWQSDIKRWFREHDADGMNSRNAVEGAIDQCQSEIDDWLNDSMIFVESEIKEVISSNNPDFSDEEVEESFDNQDGEYDTAVEELQQSVYENFEFSDWGRENRCRKMSDFVSKYNLEWPVYQSSGGSGGGEMSYSELADSWTETSGYKSTTSTGYHSAKRQPDLWIFEPDSSIKSDDSDDGGVELVSPPMPFDQGIAALAKFFQWAPSVNAYANQSCGFHIGVSLPPEIQKTIDPVKLLLFLGDEHVLAEFGRSFNTYTKSSMKSLRQRIQQWISQNYSTPQDGLAFIKSTLADPAQSVLPQMVRRGDHYVSVNIKDNYIEFRSAGGDYFEKQQEIFNTVMRYVRAMTIASDPQAEKQEYLKKLYKLLAGSIQQPDNPMGAFMRYSAGQITRDELLKIIQQKAPSNQPPGAATAQTQTAIGESFQHYEVFRARDEFKVHEFMATDDQDAQARLRRWAENNNENPRDYVVKPVIFENSTEHRDPGQPVSGSQLTPFRKKLAEKWSRKYKKGIDCANPRGFSQRAHCAGRKKRQAHGKTSSRSVSETAQNSEIHSYHKLDRILVKLCDLVDSRHAQDPEKYGLVGAALLDPKNQIATGVSTKQDGQWYHAERRAMTAYRKKYGSIPPGCIIVVTCSPCSERMDSRHGDSCTDLINSSAVKKVYCGFDDETQPENQREFNIIETADPEIRDRCRGYAEQFMDWEREQMKENTGDGVDLPSPVTETLKKVKGRWALVSRKDPSKVLQYYHGSGHPSKEWVSKVERRVHSFSETLSDDFKQGVAVEGQGVAEGKVKLYTDPGYFGAEVDDAGFDSLPVVNIPTSSLVGFEPDSKMQQPEAMNNVKKILAGLEQGDNIPPILVRKYKNGYQVLDGHHRFWAYKVAKKDTIPARVVDPKDIEEVGKQGVAEGASNNLQTIIKSFVDSPNGQKYKKYDCKTVTRAFVQWAEQNKIPAQVISLAPPSAEFIKKNPQFQGKDGQGDGHIMPIVNDNAIDFTVRQFGIDRPFENPLVTSTNSLPAVYGKFGYFTDKPEWFLGGKSHWIGTLKSIPSEIFNQNFGDEILERHMAENFADGRGPGRPGDSQRHGIPKNATMAQLTKAAKSKGRKGQLARWQLNMRRGQKKESLQELFDPGNLPEDIEIKQYVDNANHKKWTITRGDQTWKLRIEHSKDLNVWEAVLSSVTKKLSFDVTGEGSAPHIFGAVYAILVQEAKRDPNIKGYLCAAKEPSRRKLYRVLSRKLSQQLNWVYDPSTGSQLRNLPNYEVFAILSPETYDYVNKKLGQQEQLTELFDPDNLPEDIEIEMLADFGDNISWNITRGDQKWRLHITGRRSDLPGIWFVGFNSLKTATYDITGEGSAPHVFAAVGAILLQQARKNPLIKGFGFTAKEPSRIKLYHVLSQKLSKALGWTYDRELGKYFPSTWSPFEDLFFILSPEKYREVTGKLSDTSQSSAITEAKPAGVKSYQTTWRGATAQYDPEFFDVEPDELRDEAGKLIASKERLRPRATLQDRLPTKANPALVYRGMSNAEYEHILQTGKIESRGDYNFDVQKGLTYFSTDPEAAESYAHSFAPWQHKATWDNPAWVIAIPRPDPSRVRKVRGTGEHEVGIEGSIPASEIREVYRGRAVEYRPGEPNREAPSAWLHWERVSVPSASILNENEGKSLTVWDIDDTLMHTTARVFVVEPSGRRRHLSASEFNSYELRPGEKYDFAEFTDSKLFYDTSKPIEKIWRTAQNTLANIGKRPGSRMIIVTARAEFDNTSLFLKTFEKHGMDMSKVKVYTVAGASNKKPLIKRLLLKGQFTECRLFDDHPGNLRDFLSLHQDFPDIRLKAFAVGNDGSVGKPVILGGK